ncbi:MAG TPA: response regulator [Streptosporangiaceae bacterium]|nr:response regulator [Streptosporangiaceae bacterium]
MKHGHSSDEDNRDPATILIADDEQDLRELVAYRLSRAGYGIVEARDGQEALELALNEPPDMAVLDVMMPRMDGLELTRRLRKDPVTRRVPIILLTASVQEADIRRGLDAGADYYLAKPFNPAELLARVRAALRRH